MPFTRMLYLQWLLLIEETRSNSLNKNWFASSTYNTIDVCLHRHCRELYIPLRHCFVSPSLTLHWKYENVSRTIPCRSSWAVRLAGRRRLWCRSRIQRLVLPQTLVPGRCRQTGHAPTFPCPSTASSGPWNTATGLSQGLAHKQTASTGKEMSTYHKIILFQAHRPIGYKTRIHKTQCIKQSTVQTDENTNQQATCRDQLNYFLIRQNSRMHYEI